jgi:hypothetical protein
VIENIPGQLGSGPKTVNLPQSVAVGTNLKNLQLYFVGADVNCPKGFDILHKTLPIYDE